MRLRASMNLSLRASSPLSLSINLSFRVSLNLSLRVNLSLKVSLGKDYSNDIRRGFIAVSRFRGLAVSHLVSI